MSETGKSCGDCGLCCKLMGVDAIAKAPLTWCRQFKRGCGCLIYETRPQACADFLCYWLHVPNLDETWRPDRAGFVMHLSDGGRKLQIEVDPATPNAWRAEPYRSTFLAWAERGEARALELVVYVGRRGWRITPGGEVDLGLAREQVRPQRAKGAALRSASFPRAR